MFNFNLNVLDLMLSLENPVLTFLFKWISKLASETLYLIIISMIYWCISKRKAFHMINVICLTGYISIITKGFLKIPRPFTYDGIHSLYEESAKGYSFPSTHVQLATTFWSSLMVLFKKKIVYLIGIVFIVLVAISRLYLRVHWFSDVVGSIILGVVIIYLYVKFIVKISDRKLLFLQWGIVMFSLIAYYFTDQVDNFKLLGITTGTTMGMILENKFVNINEKNVFIVQVCKIIIGIIIIMAMQVILKKSIPDLIFVRYALVGFSITFICPYVFRIFRIHR
ncbi:phosphatase PAP2 family protein (plasmid) [Bacillus tropicus]|uniref:phosphatase PAP2 family protein n=1 Tax=Bacillus TaxID=1386 RepID=UPI0010355F22|nr:MULTISPECIES: phosphatase PAP2 family protein [Bacillus]WBO93173.1 phosphatase PAP2 family protein [Bacillus tropicus]